MKNQNLTIKFQMVLLFVAMLSSINSFGQWQSINPGAGGQVQDIVCDPNIPNRVFLASDMEGVYESTDNGQSWHETGHLKQNRVYAVAITPGNSNKMFVGTLYGLEVSNDAGSHFDLVASSKKLSIGAIAVSPSSTNTVIAGVGWRDDSDFASNFGMSRNGNIVTFRSTNGGSSWQKIEISGSGDRNVYSIQFDKNNANIAYMGTSQGVFKSTNAGASWFALGGNPGTNTGVSLSPNGQYLYGTFNYDLYVTSTASISWQSKMSGLDGNAKYWYPEVDPRDNGSSHKVTMAILGDRPGLYEGTFNWSGNSLSNYSWKKIWEGTSGYDTGWDKATPNPRVAHYTPASWSRAIWSTTNQTIFQATPGGSGWGWNWNNKYSIPNNNFNVGGNPTYSGRGTASTYTYGIAMQGSYMIQTMADNGWMESWDGGESWSNMQMRFKGQQSDSQSADIGYDNGKYIAISESSPSCYGGACFSGGRLWTKILSATPSTSDEWIQVNGSVKGPNGTFNGGQYRDISVSPVKRDRVFACSNDYGVFMIDDLWAAANGASNLQYIGLAGIRTKKIAPHPTNADIVFVTSNSGGGQGVYKGVKSGSNWNFSQILSGSGWDAEVDVWEYNGQVYVFYFGYIGGEFKGMLSMDQGNTWNTVMTSNIAKGLNTPSWYSQVAEDFRFSSKGGIAGYDNKIVLCYYDHRQQQTYGVYRGTINGANNVSWEDWTGDIHFGGFTSAIVKEGMDGNRYFFASTAGAGAIKRAVDAVATTPPNAPSNLAASTVSSGQISLSWNDNSNNESGFKIERKQGSGSYSQVGTASGSSFTDSGLSASTSYTYKVRAYNSAGNSAYTGEASATTNAPEPCSSNNLVTNGEFDNALSGWSAYSGQNGSVATTSVVTNGGLSGTNSAFTDISNGGSVGSSDIQLWNNVSLVSGKTYEVKYKAKAASNRTMRVQLHQEGGGWTGYGEHTINLTTSSADYTFEVTMSTTDSNARLNFFLGGSSANVWIDGVVVSEKCANTIIPTSVSISGCPSSSVTVGGAVNLDETVAPSNATDKNVTWSSSNTSVATVSNSGLVTAVAAGSATITVTTVSGSKTATCDVTVVPAVVVPTSVSVSGCPGSNLEIGATANLDETVLPSNATDKSVTWSSSNNSVATVSNTGLVTAVAAGSATITVTTNSGSKTATCGVTVNAGSGGCTNPNLVSNAEFDSALSNWSTYSGQNGSSATSSVVTNGGLSGTNSALINISNGGSVGSSDVQFWNNVSLVSGKTYEVIYQAKAVSNRTMRVQLHQDGGGWTGYGEHTINLSSSAATYSFEVTMSTTDNNARLNFFLGGSSANVWIDGVIVREKCANPIIPTSVSISGCPGSNMTIGATANLNETVSPSNATDKSVTWSSSNNSVATVSSSGLVTAVAAGSATITVTTVSGSKTATCGVTVSAPACNNPNIVSNGEFDSGTANWQFYVNTGAGANASWAVVSGAGLSGSNSAKVTISNGSNADSQVQLYSNLGSLTSGKTYQVIFKAKAAGSRSMRVGVLKGSSPWTNYLSQNVNLTTSVQDFTLEFTMSENSSDSRVDFFLGNNNNDVWVDAVIVKEKCSSGSRNAAPIASLSEVKLYPNPMAIGQELTIDASELSQFNMQIISMEGRVIFEKQFSSVESSIKLRVDELNHNGIYMIRFNDGTNQWVQKLIVR